MTFKFDRNPHFLITLLSCILLHGNIFPQLYYDWSASCGGLNQQNITSSTVDVALCTYNAGLYKSTVDFDPGPGIFNMNTYSWSTTDVFIQKLDPNGNFLWAERLGNNNSNEIRINKIKTDPAGYLYITGHYQGTIDFDPGADTLAITSSDPVSKDFFIEKLSPSGDLVWVKSLGEVAYDDIAMCMNIDPAGNLYISGRYNGTIDFDPGGGIFNLTATPIGFQDIFLLKLNSSGDFIWAKSFDNDYECDVSQLEIDPAGNILLGGEYNGLMDLDPGAGFDTVSVTSTDIFIIKLDENGNHIWGRSFGGPGAEHISSLCTDNHSNVIMTGSFMDTVDFDPGPNTSILISNSQFEYDGAYILKFDPSGNFLWVSGLVNDYYVVTSGILTDSSNSIYVTGSFSDSLDIDPGPGTHFLSCNPLDVNSFVLKQTENGNFIDASHFSKHIGMALQGIDNTQSIYVYGSFTDTTDFDPGPGVQSAISQSPNGDFYNIKLSQDSCSNFTLVFDSVFNVPCGGFGLISCHAENGTAPFSYSWDTHIPVLDSTLILDTNGIYTVTVMDAGGCSRSESILVNNPVSATGFDLQGNLTATHFRPNQTVMIIFDAFNDGCSPVTGEAVLVLDSMLSILDVYPTPSSISGDSLFWNFTSIDYDSTHIAPYLVVNTSAFAIVGDTIHLALLTTPVSGDMDTTNNTRLYHFPVLNSYDPNDKTVYPMGECPDRQVLINEPLTYTIRFQNTGNAEALNIYILDTLDAGLDLNTVRIISQSHAMYTEVLPGNVLKFVFNHIMLPDSSMDFAHSHGYVVFEILPLNNIPDGTPLTNKAHVHFDFNPPVATNSVQNTAVSHIIACDLIVPANNDLAPGVNLYPNPTQGIIYITLENITAEIFNISIQSISGETLIKQTGNHLSDGILNLSQLANGIYFITIETSQGYCTKKIIKSSIN